MSCCVPECSVRFNDGVSLHRFPDPENDTERFQVWVLRVGGDIVGLSNDYIKKNRRVCHRHFEGKFHGMKGKLSKIAIPTLLLTEKPIMHGFPNFLKFPDRFRLWVSLVGGKLDNQSDYDSYKKRKICDKHFTDKDRNRFGRLNALAVPSLNLKIGFPLQRKFLKKSAVPTLFSWNSASGQDTSARAERLERRNDNDNPSTEHNYTRKRHYDHMYCRRETLQGTPLHVFPHPEKFYDQFKTWVNIVGGKVVSAADKQKYRKMKMCDIHFLDKDKTRHNRLSRDAIPKLHLPGASNKEPIEERDPLKLEDDCDNIDNDTENVHQTKEKSREISHHQHPLRLKQDCLTINTKTKANLLVARRYGREPIAKVTQDERNKLVIDGDIEKPIIRDDVTKNKLTCDDATVNKLVCDNVREDESICDDGEETMSAMSDAVADNDDEEDLPATMYEGAVCISCMSTENLEELTIDIASAGGKSYAASIEACFDIGLSVTKGNGYICGGCIVKLNDAIAFKKQILKSVSILLSVNIRQLVSDPSNIKSLGLDDKNGNVSNKENKESHSNITILPPAAAYSKKDTPPRPLRPPQTHQKPRLARPKKYPVYQFKIGPEDTVCRVCELDYRSNRRLMWHYAHHYPIFKCTECPKAFMKIDSLKLHKRTHCKGPFVCSECGVEFSAMSTLIGHKRSEHNMAPMFKCSLCNQRFDTMLNRRKHLRTVHKIAERKYACRYYDKTFPMSAEEGQQASRAHNKATYACPICEFTSTRELLRSHLVNKHSIGEKTYECVQCAKKFCDSDTLMHHMKSHYLRYECKICSKKFPDKILLKRHIEMHTYKGLAISDPGARENYFGN